MNMIVKSHCLMVPVGSVAREYGKEYTMTLSGFKAADGSGFPDTNFWGRNGGKKESALTLVLPFSFDPVFYPANGCFRNLRRHSRAE